MVNKILITGATGNVGAEVARLLAARGVPMRALVRNRAKAKSIELPNVEIAEGDMDKPRTLGPALAGVDKVFLVSSPEPRQVELQANVIDAAKQAGVRHIVKISAKGAAPDALSAFQRWHAETEQYLARSGMAFTYLQPNFFMQNALSFAPSIASDGKFYGSMKDGKASFVDLRDVAAVAANALADPGHEGKTYVVTGPEAFSFSDMARRLSSAIGKSVTYVDLPREALVQAMMGSGMPDWQAQGIADLYEWGSTGAEAGVTDVVAKVGKKTPITFDQFARESVSAFESTATA
jgi:uncharacterized protein YbjT (DUF2867 family)